MNSNNKYSETLNAEGVVARQKLWLAVIIIVMNKTHGAWTKIIGGVGSISVNLDFGKCCSHRYLLETSPEKKEQI